MPRRHDEEKEGQEEIRAFVAVELGADARTAAAGLQQVLRRGPGGDGVRWVRPEAMHVTLRFLGQVASTTLAALVAAVRSEVSPRRPFALHLAGLSGLPGPRRPRVVILDVEPAAPLEDLAAAVDRGAVTAGFAPEARRFRAHLTLGRVRGRYALPPDPPVPPPASFEVAEVVLFRSLLGRGGSRYIPLERVALGGSDHPNT